jgi:hypothetical protein
MRFLYSATAALIAALIVLALPVAAQTDLQYGTAVTGQTDASYHINGKEGDLINAEAVGITPDLIPVLTLLDASGRQLAQAQSDPLTPGSSVLHARLPLDGDYTLKVTGLYSRQGDFVLSLSARPITSAHALAEGRTTVNIDATPQAFHFAGPAEIHLISPNGAFSAQIHSQPGDLIAEINDLPSAVFALDSNGEFEMMLRTTGAAVTVEIDYLDRPDLAQTVEAQIATINTLASTEEAALEGTALVEATEPTAEATLAPTSAPTQPPTATTAPTSTPTEAPTIIPATPTATEIPVEVAPNDANYQLTIALGSSAAVSDAVSFPSGDHEDRVFYDISGLDSSANAANGKAHLVIKATCSGTGTDEVTFFAAGSLYHCGDTIVDRTVTSETHSGSIIVTAASGDNSLVEWSLTGSATRAN